MKVTHWYYHWFGKDYLQLYQHRSPDEARRTVRWLLDVLPLPHNALILDLACGNGRHIAALKANGFQAFGLDLSWPLLEQAQQSGIHLTARGDMRFLPWKRGVFDAVFSLFTSFGYFDSDAENRAVLEEVARILKKGGIYVLDYLNVNVVCNQIVPTDELIIQGKRATILRWIDEHRRRVEKRILIHESERATREYRESVRLYSKNELINFFYHTGITAEQIYGDYHGSTFTIDSPRLIIIGRKNA